jgi:hypothetical protein
MIIDLHQSLKSYDWRFPTLAEGDTYDFETLRMKMSVRGFEK